jgi:hypothetical protein
VPQPLSGPGVGLPLPQYLFPSELQNAPYDFSTNVIALEAGQGMFVPAGTWYIDPGVVSLVQFLDPVTGTWIDLPTVHGGLGYWKSDGFTLRIMNVSGVPVSATVSAGGTGYLPSNTIVTPSAGNSTWRAVVGGALSAITVNPGPPIAAGGPYGIAPLVLIPAPPPGGVPATATATLTGSTVSAITITNPGAGYPSPPPIIVLPSPFDPNIAAGVSISQASVTATLGPVGAVTAVLPTNYGNPQATVTLTIAGAGTGATATVTEGPAAATDQVHIQTGA